MLIFSLHQLKVQQNRFLLLVRSVLGIFAGLGGNRLEIQAMYPCGIRLLPVIYWIAVREAFFVQRPRSFWSKS